MLLLMLFWLLLRLLHLLHLLHLILKLLQHLLTTHLIATYCQNSLAKEVAREARTCAPIPASTTGRRPKRSAAKPATRLNSVTYEKDGT